MYGVVGFAVGVAVGVGVGDAVGVAPEVCPEPAMVHDPALDVHVCGAVNAPLSVNPIVAVAPGASDSFHDAFVADSLPLATPPVAFHMLTLVPAHGIDTVQPVIGCDPVFVTVMSTLRPVPQSDVTFTATVMSAATVGDEEADELEPDDVGAGVGAAVGAALGEAVGSGDTAPSGGAPTTVHVPLGIEHELGTSDDPRDWPMKPKVIEVLAARPVLHDGPVMR